MLRVPASLVAGAFLLLFGVAGTAAAQTITTQQAESSQILRANIDFRLIKAQPLAVSSGVEVAEFFWYGCPHCNRLQPVLERWISRKPADVTIRRIPAILRETWTPHARIYYTLEALGEVTRLHQQVYRSYHVDKLQMSKPEVMSEWAVNNGIAREHWDTAYNSAAVQNKVDEAARLTRAYDITGTPSLVVNGHYLTSGNMAESFDSLIAILDGLVNRARDQAAR